MANERVEPVELLAARKGMSVSEFVALKPTKIEQLDSPEADGTQADSPKVKIKLKDPELGDTEKGTIIHVHSTGPDLTHDIAGSPFSHGLNPELDPVFNGGEVEKMLAGMRGGMESTKLAAEGLAAMAAGGDKDKGADGPSLNSIGMDFA